MNLFIKLSAIISLFMLNPKIENVSKADSGINTIVPCQQLDSNWSYGVGQPSHHSSNGIYDMDTCFNFTGNTWSITSSVNDDKPIESRTVTVYYETENGNPPFVSVFQYDGTSGATITHSFNLPNDANLVFYNSDVNYTDGSWEASGVYVYK